MLESNSTKESSIYKLVLVLHEIIFAGFLFKYARIRACRVMGRPGLLSEKEPRLNAEESRLLKFSREIVYDFFQTFKANNGLI
jgi:hypothetical protein